MKIAIIGGGAAGMTTAYLLNKQHQVTLFEKQSILGGNIRTLNKNVQNSSIPTDVAINNGVIEFQKDYFINFHKLMKALDVEMAEIHGGSSALYLSNGRYILRPGVIRGSSISALAKMRAYLKLLPIIASQAQFSIHTKNSAQLKGKSMSTFWKGHQWHQWQRLLLMYGFSIPYAELDNFPAELGVNIINSSGYGTRWTRVVGGVYTYIEKILEQFSGKIVADASITAVARSGLVG